MGSFPALLFLSSPKKIWQFWQFWHRYFFLVVHFRYMSKNLVQKFDPNYKRVQENIRRAEKISTKLQQLKKESRP